MSFKLFNIKLGISAAAILLFSQVPSYAAPAQLTHPVTAEKVQLCNSIYERILSSEYFSELFSPTVFSPLFSEAERFDLLATMNVMAASINFQELRIDLAKKLAQALPLSDLQEVATQMQNPAFQKLLINAPKQITVSCESISAAIRNLPVPEVQSISSHLEDKLNRYMEFRHVNEIIATGINAVVGTSNMSIRTTPLFDLAKSQMRSRYQALLLSLYNESELDFVLDFGMSEIVIRFEKASTLAMGELDMDRYINL